MRGLTILVIIVVVILALFFIAKSRAPDMLGNNLSNKIGVSISIDSMGFGPSSVEVDNIAIGNPRGYSLPKAFSAEEIDLHAPISAYFRKDVIIELIEVKNIYLGLEFDSAQGASGNWTRIMHNYAQNAGLNEEGKEEKRVLIKKVIFTNIETDLAFRSEGGKIRKLPKIGRIELTNIGSEGGFPTDQVMSSVLGQMLIEVFKQQRLDNMIQGILTDPARTVESLLEPFKDLFNRAPQIEMEEPKSA